MELGKSRLVAPSIIVGSVRSIGKVSQHGLPAARTQMLKAKKKLQEVEQTCRAHIHMQHMAKEVECLRGQYMAIVHDWVQSTISPIAVSVLVGANHACPDSVDVLLTNLKELDNLLPQDLKELFLADDFDNVREGVVQLERLVTVGLVQNKSDAFAQDCIEALAVDERGAALRALIRPQDDAENLKAIASLRSKVAVAADGVLAETVAEIQSLFRRACVQHESFDPNLERPALTKEMKVLWC